MYLIIILGFVAAKRLDITKESIANLLIYIVNPMVMFIGAYRVHLSFGNLALPFVIFFLCVTSSMLFYFVASVFWQDTRRNLVALAAGCANSGYFGLPVVTAVFGVSALGLAVVGNFGFLLFEITIGVFLMARGHYGVMDSLRVMLKMPAIYTFAVGILCNGLQIPLAASIDHVADLFIGAYSVLGMLMVGFGMAHIGRSSFDVKLVSILLFAKFIFWPVSAGVIVVLNRHVLHLLSIHSEHILLLMSLVPLAANTVALAIRFRIIPDKAAMVVVLSTLIALFYIPLVLSGFLPLFKLI
ncbi:Membrane transport protein [Piscirickettsia salmonis]|uniref:Membrane protein n=1 Tax=Piscirickettsia salmonis TaxID=1238 RepID=A0A1L6TEK2_PISSA|nr:hypothetical protein [Piscirickettsia salmonis]AKP72612.2 hypothetical protein PSLF89_466 [Piscirickettsia salmonis LF-89 = ATCC VR-1361]ALB23900.1 membrane protein [Piscirickettsia salmonis]ALY03731.1 hypothetical protein AWE47_13400 [Piscirickettsia salmonis]AMA43293.1 hypothetical protein AWJ11_13625 [Piscirickettsia salmonis]AOS35763.1 hypothetical protein AVM72_10745 [Piscirickettsia salmonis]